MDLGKAPVCLDHSPAQVLAFLYLKPLGETTLLFVFYFVLQLFMGTRGLASGPASQPLDSSLEPLSGSHWSFRQGDSRVVQLFLSGWPGSPSKQLTPCLFVFNLAVFPLNYPLYFISSIFTGLSGPPFSLFRWMQQILPGAPSLKPWPLQPVFHAHPGKAIDYENLVIFMINIFTATHYSSYQALTLWCSLWGFAWKDFTFTWCWSLRALFPFAMLSPTIGVLHKCLLPWSDLPLVST